MKRERKEPFVGTDHHPTPNGNWNRTHEENVKRRKLRRIRKSAQQTNRK